MVTQKPVSEATQTPPAGQPVADQAITQLSELAALGQSVGQRYLGQAKLTGQLAKAEWQLSVRSLTIAAALVVCFGVGVVLLGFGLLLVAGYLLFLLTESVLISAAVLLLLQLGLLWWCWRNLGYVLSQVGFDKSWQQLQLLFGHKPVKEAPDADR